MNGMEESAKLREIWEMMRKTEMTEAVKNKGAGDMEEAAKMEKPTGMSEKTGEKEPMDMEEDVKTTKEEEERLINEMRLCFLSRGENESLARIAVTGFIACLDPTLDVLDDIRTAVSEAVTNAIIHGYQGKEDGVVYLSAFLYEREDCGHLLRVDIEDTGIGIEDVKKAMEPLYSTSPDGERAGMGFAFMSAFTDRLKVESKPRLGTCVSMWKELALPEAFHDAE